MTDISMSPQAIGRTGRVMRRPQHTFQLRAKPFTIQPFLIAPVLPGETLKSGEFQARVVSDPVKNKLVGWWCEHYFFYVKHRDLDGRDTFTDMMIDPSTSLAAFNAAAVEKTYHAGPGINWTAQCLTAVVRDYFREENEATAIVTIDGMPAAKINNSSWMQSLMDETVITEGTAPGAGETEEVIAENQRTYEWLRANQLTNLTYEDFLRTYGVNIPKKDELHRPELIRYSREWQYPVNTVEPSTGVPSSALSWAIRERMDKDRFFKEPGFIFGVQVTRPKVYYGRQYGAGVSMLDSALMWLPAALKADVWVSLREYANNAGPLNGVSDPTNGYIVDVRDLFLYGDQFINYSMADTESNFVGLPTAALEHLYPSETDVDALFVNSAAEYVRSDGIVSLQILGTQIDHTPRPIG